MPATVVRVDLLHPEPEIMAEAANRLRRGELVVFPTETVYGLGADALNADAVQRIYEAKGRPAWNPVISHVADTAAAAALTRHWTEQAQRLAEAFWPGPLTMVLQRAHHIPDISTAGLNAIAVRVPRHPVALALLRAFGGAVAAPSANRFTQVSPTSAAHVVSALGDRVEYILDGGDCDVGIESTVVDLTGNTPTILRPGMISAAQLSAVLGQTIAHGEAVAEPARALSPGTAQRHYAPRADVWLLNADNVQEIRDALRLRAESPPGAGPVTAILQSALLQDAPGVNTVVRMPDSAELYARALYRELHTADATGTAILVIEVPPDTDEWKAIRDRLMRASR